MVCAAASTIYLLLSFSRMTCDVEPATKTTPKSLGAISARDEGPLDSPSARANTDGRPTNKTHTTKPHCIRRLHRSLLLIIGSPIKYGLTSKLWSSSFIAPSGTKNKRIDDRSDWLGCPVLREIEAPHCCSWLQPPSADKYFRLAHERNRAAPGRPPQSRQTPREHCNAEPWRTLAPNEHESAT